MSDHPSELALEAHLLDPAKSNVAGHLAACERCRARVARMEKEGEDFRRFILPATLDAVVEKNARRRKPWLALAALVPVAAAALVVIIGVSRGPDVDYVGTKGGLLLAVRFRVQPPGRCSLWLLSVDESGQISRIYPATGEAAPQVAPGALPGGAFLDGTRGLERFYAVCTPEPIPFTRIEAAVRSTLAQKPQAVRSGEPLRDLPRGSSQATLVVEKR
jgi:hypothetical protein